MGLFGWGEKDNSTAQQRKDWRNNAQKQNGQDQDEDNQDPSGPARHRRR